jgi:hypothetical protein
MEGEHHGVRSWTLIGSVALSLLLCACGGSSSSSSSATSSAGSNNTPTGASNTSTATAPTSTTQSTTTASGSSRCVAADLAGEFLGQQGATGHGELGFGLRNTSGHSCRTFGYPGVLFLDRAGRALPTSSVRTTHDFFGPAPEGALTVAAGSIVSFRIGVTHGVTSTAHCTTAYGLQVIPPDDTATLRIAIPGGAYECATATVSPLQPGTSAYG